MIVFMGNNKRKKELENQNTNECLFMKSKLHHMKKKSIDISIFCVQFDRSKERERKREKRLKFFLNLQRLGVLMI